MSPTPNRGRFGWPGAVGVLISIGLLWWTLHDVDLGEVVAQARRAKPGPFGVALALATVTFPLRTQRWRYLLRPEDRDLPWTPLWHATAIGFMANNLLPARAGEVARMFAASRLAGVRFTAALASVAVERVFDGVALAALMTVAIMSGGFAPGTKVAGVSLVGLAGSAAALSLAALIGVMLIVYSPDWVRRISARVFDRVLPERLRERARDYVDGLLSGMASLRSPVRLANVLFWSVLIWTTYAASYIAGFRAFDIAAPNGAAFLMQGLIALGVAVPSSPGFFGVMEAVMRASLGLYGIDPTVAVSYAVTYHIATFIPISLMGLWSLSRAHLHLADLRRVRSGGPPAA